MGFGFIEFDKKTPACEKRGLEAEYMFGRLSRPGPRHRHCKACQKPEEGYQGKEFTEEGHG